MFCVFPVGLMHIITIYIQKYREFYFVRIMP